MEPHGRGRSTRITHAIGTRGPGIHRNLEAMRRCVESRGIPKKRNRKSADKCWCFATVSRRPLRKAVPARIFEKSAHGTAPAPRPHRSLPAETPAAGPRMPWSPPRVGPGSRPAPLSRTGGRGSCARRCRSRHRGRCPGRLVPRQRRTPRRASSPSRRRRAAPCRRSSGRRRGS